VSEAPELATATAYTFAAANIAPPLPGEVRLNNPTSPNLANTMWIHHVNGVGVDCANIFRMLTSSDRIFIQDLANSNAYFIYRLSGNPTDNLAGRYITLQLQFQQAGSGVIPTGQPCFLGM
jgi:hypothetical protein